MAHEAITVNLERSLHSGVEKAGKILEGSRDFLDGLAKRLEWIKYIPSVALRTTLLVATLSTIAIGTSYVSNININSAAANQEDLKNHPALVSSSSHPPADLSVGITAAGPNPPDRDKIESGNNLNSEYKTHGIVTDASLKEIGGHQVYTVDDIKKFSTPVIVDKTHNTKVLIPDPLYGMGFGPFVQPANKTDGNVYWSSLHDDSFFKRSDGSHRTIEIMFYSDQSTLDRTGNFFLGIMDGTHDGIVVLRSDNGGVNYANTGRSINYQLDLRLKSPNGDRMGTMRGQFNQIVNKLTGK